MRILPAVLLSLLFLLAACKNTLVDPPPGTAPGAVSKGVYVLNEGMFGDPAGARLSFLDLLTDSVYFDLFETANAGAHLGSLGDDLEVYGDRIYTLMSGSENLAVLDTTDHALVQSATYAGTVPHDLLIDPLRNSIYLTQLFSGSVARVDLTTLAQLETIPVGANPQGMAFANDYLFVCNSGFGSGNTVTVISAVTHATVETLVVGDGPTRAVVGMDGRVWIACTGNAFGTPPTLGSVYAVNPISLIVEDVVPFPENLWGSIAAGTDGSIYLLGVTSGSFYGGPVHRILSSSLAIEMNFLPGTYYSLAADPATGRIYAADARDFQGDGELFIFEQNGTAVTVVPTQRGPGAIAFRY
ncbi:MAG: YncE family protein [Ignavibacteria bacterium]|nr:YncE family protein [Ignavibacteria bacterium]